MSGKPAAVGRFAPSPTGPLHFGSLVAALGSCLEARRRGGAWLLRMEDLDEPRCRREHADDIMRTLAACGFEWDGEVWFQSRRQERYREILEALRRRGDVYPCACTRRELADSALAPDGAHVYPGTCRGGLPPGKPARSYRLQVNAAVIEYDDAIQGHIRQDLAAEVGDFVLLRADGYFAYQLAVVADDADQGVTQVVRGADLLASTPRQIFLQQRLGLPQPAYAHLPVAVNAAGEKLSKQTRAPAVDGRRPVPALFAVLEFLGQQPPAELRLGSIAALWTWARVHWDLARVPRLLHVAAPGVAGDAEHGADEGIG
jgi:glutamyl-Q tRNA(Asp) synthetase